MTDEKGTDSLEMWCGGVAHKCTPGLSRVELPPHFALECGLPGDAPLCAKCSGRMCCHKTPPYLPVEAELLFIVDYLNLNSPSIETPCS
jgi:hypothetical protein